MVGAGVRRSAFGARIAWIAAPVQFVRATLTASFIRRL